MALIKCAECGKEISDKAAACVHCGCPISVSTQANSANTGNAPRVLSMDFDAVLYGADNESTPQKVYVKELGRDVEFTIKNSTQVGDTIQTNLTAGSKYNHILFTAVSVYKTRQAPPASSTNAQSNNNADPMAFIKDFMGTQNKNSPTVTIEAILPNSQTGYTVHSVYVPEFNQTVKVNVPNNITEGQTLMISADTLSTFAGFKITSPLKVSIAKVTRMAAPVQTVSAPSGMDMAQKIKTLKRRIYTMPIIRLFLSLYFILSIAGIFLSMYLYPDGGAPAFLMNIASIGFTLGFISVFIFICIPYIVGFYPDPGFFKTRKIIKHLESRNLLEKAVIEMETCQPVPFGNKMCLSDNFLYPKKKNGVIIPCDEILWVYGSYIKRKSIGLLMVGTEKWGLQCFSSIFGRKQFDQQVPAAILAVQKRNPSVMAGETKENQQKYFQYVKTK